jgi:hypothetical protein
MRSWEQRGFRSRHVDEMRKKGDGERREGDVDMN